MMQPLRGNVGIVSVSQGTLREPWAERCNRFAVASFRRQILQQILDLALSFVVMANDQDLRGRKVSDGSRDADINIAAFANR